MIALSCGDQHVFVVGGPSEAQADYLSALPRPCAGRPASRVAWAIGHDDGTYTCSRAAVEEAKQL